MSGVAVFTIAQGVDGVGVENGPVANGVLPDAPADLDDGRPLIAVPDLELFSRRRCPQSALRLAICQQATWRRLRSFVRPAERRGP